MPRAYRDMPPLERLEARRGYLVWAEEVLCEQGFLDQQRQALGKLAEALMLCEEAGLTIPKDFEQGITKMRAEHRERAQETVDELNMMVFDDEDMPYPAVNDETGAERRIDRLVVASDGSLQPMSGDNPHAQTIHRLEWRDK